VSKKNQPSKSKKLYYRRARWDNQGKSTLETLLKDAHANLPTVGHRTFKTSSGSELKGANFDTTDKGVFLHIVSCTPDQPTSTVNKDKSASSATIMAEPAPTGKDFMDGDIFLLIKDNHVILCPSGVRESVANTYFWHILDKSKQKSVAGSLELDKVSNTSKLQMINMEGVKELQMTTSLYQASLHQLGKGQSMPSSALWPSISSQFRHIFNQDPALKDISELENLNVTLSLKFDGAEGRKKHKNPNFGDAGRERLLKTAKMMLEENDEDGFVIITGGNNRITADEVRISDSYTIKVLGKSLNCSDAWEKLEQYFNKLKITGALSQ
jgi:hypothetical protein